MGNYKQNKKKIDKSNAYRWHNAKDDLPEKDGEYIVASNLGEVFTAFYDPYGKWYSSDHAIGDILAWRLLPKYPLSFLDNIGCNLFNVDYAANCSSRCKWAAWYPFPALTPIPGAVCWVRYKDSKQVKECKAIFMSEIIDGVKTDWFLDYYNMHILDVIAFCNCT